MAKAGKDFTEILIKKGVLGRDQVQEAIAMQQSSGVKLQDAIVRLGYAAIEDVMQAMAEQFGVEFVHLEDVEIPSAVVQLVPESVARENVILPLSADNGTLKIIMSDPMDFETVDKLRFILNRDVEIALAPRESIQEAINKHYGQTETESVDSMLQEFTDTAIDFTETEGAATTKGGGMNVADENAPIVKLVNLIIQEAVNLRASDIHIEPFGERVRVRYRIDGVCVERDSPPRRLLAAIISRLKIMGSIDIAEKRRPQDGRIKMQVNGKDIDLRVSVLPTNHGQSIVMRILNKESIMVGIRELGFGDEEYRRFQTIIKRPNGIFLVTGPTGSGKTTTLYAALAELNRPDKKIITAEEPVEYYLPGINQTEVKSAIGLTFARIIRSMLRQSPNVILVGEIRDKETADMAIQASLTGHLVFSTLHTNDAPGAITRLIDIGVQPFLVASSVMAVMAQRLVRKVCPKCQEPDQPDPHELKTVGLTPERVRNANFMRGRGCNHCHHTGYRGRLAIFEMMQMNSTLREMSFRREPTQNIRRQARLFGMRSLLEDGILKSMKGITTLEEVLETCHHEGVSI
jgi:type IV pilus assembly protein PilB